MSVRKKIARGALWVLLEKFGQQAMTLGIFLAVARLVGPEQFGLFSLAFVVVILIQTIMTGIVDGVVSQHIEDDPRLSTLFWAIFGLGTAMSLGTGALAAPFATLMKDERVESLLLCLSPLPLLTATAAVPTALVQARMDFRVFTLRSLASTLVGGLVAIVMAVKGAGAYSMVAQQIATLIVVNLIIWPGAGWRPRTIYDRTLLRPMLAPGLKMTGSQILDFLEIHGPRILVGLFLGPVQAGYYAFALRIYLALREVVVLPATVVLFPALAHIKHDRAETHKIFGWVVTLTGFVAFPAIAGTAATAPLFVPLFFGPAWKEATPVLQLLLLGMIWSPLVLILRDLLRALGMTGAFVTFQSMLSGTAFFVMIFLAPLGLIPVIWGKVAMAFLAFPLILSVTERATGLRLWPTMLQLWPFILASMAMGAAVDALDAGGLRFVRDWTALAASVVSGIVVYSAVCLPLRVRQFGTFVTHIKALRGKGAIRPETGTPPGI